MCKNTNMTSMYGWAFASVWTLPTTNHQDMLQHRMLFYKVVDRRPPLPCGMGKGHVHLSECVLLADVWRHENTTLCLCVQSSSLPEPKTVEVNCIGDNGDAALSTTCPSCRQSATKSLTSRQRRSRFELASSHLPWKQHFIIGCFGCRRV